VVANTPAYLDLNTAKLEVTVVVEDSAEEKVVEEREGVVRVVVDSAAEEAKETAEEAMDSEEEAMDSEEAEKAMGVVDSAEEEAMDSEEEAMDSEEAEKATVEVDSAEEEAMDSVEVAMDSEEVEKATEEVDSAVAMDLEEDTTSRHIRTQYR
jgi:hypothetical protein